MKHRSFLCRTMRKNLVQMSLKRSIYGLQHWETWHWLVKYLPMIPFWIAHCIKARSWWFFTAANPTLTFGGYEGENKMEMYDLLPEGTYPKTMLIKTTMSRSAVETQIRAGGFDFPIAVKPDVGRMGLMFRKINSLSALMKYHDQMKVDYIIQEFINYPLEVSVFYYRFPTEQKGTITGFVRKDCLSVTGDGISCLYELMLQYPRVQFRFEEMKIKHAASLNHVIPCGENYILCDALNLSRGGKLVSLEHEKDEQLLALFDAFSYAGDFYFGRYDIKCLSIDDLKKGKNFSILEFNGSGAEPHHVYGNGNSFLKAMKILLEHWSILYRISLLNHKKGIPYWNFNRGVQHLLKARKHFKILRSLEFNSIHGSYSRENSTLKNKPALNHYALTINNHDSHETRRVNRKGIQEISG